MVSKKNPRPTNSSSVPSYQQPTKRTMLNSRCGLVFPVTRIGRYMRHIVRANRISLNASIYMTAVLEQLCQETLFIASEQTRLHGRVTVKPSDIINGVERDTELNSLLGFEAIFDIGDVSGKIEAKHKARRQKKVPN